MANDAPDQARYAFWNFTGASTANCTVTIPQVARVGWVSNNSTHSVILTTGSGTTLTVPVSATYLYNCDGTNVTAVQLTATGSLTVPGGVTSNALDSGGANFRAISGNYGAMLRNDGTNVYLLQTASGASTGSFNSLRPFSWNLTTGAVTLDATGAGVVSGGALAVVGAITAGALTTSGAITAGSLTVSGATSLQATTAATMTVAGAVSGSSLSLTGGPVLIPNNTAYQAKDTGGTARLLIALDSANNADCYVSAGVAWRVLNQAGSVALLNITNAGAATFSSSVGAASFAATAGVSGATLAASGAITGASVAATGAVTGASLGSSGTLSVAGAAGVTGALSAGSIGVVGGLTVGGAAGLQGITATTLTTTGAATISGLLQCNGSAGSGGNSAYMLTSGVFAGVWGFAVSLNCAQGVAAASYGTTSDQRLKTNIADLSADQGYAWINNARPRSYTMDGRPQAGFVAQEDIAGGRHQAVMTCKDDDPRFANGDGFAPPGHRLYRDYQMDNAFLTAALKGLLSRVNDLERTVAAR